MKRTFRMARLVLLAGMGMSLAPMALAQTPAPDAQQRAPAPNAQQPAPAYSDTELKTFAVAALEPGEYVLSFKCSPDDFAELTERPGIKPAPYLARAQWVALAKETTMPRRELEGLLRKSYDLVVAKLPKSAAAKLGEAVPEKRTARKR